VLLQTRAIVSRFAGEGKSGQYRAAHHVLNMTFKILKRESAAENNHLASAGKG